MKHIDIIISGGGIAGLCATCIFAQEGYDVICVEPNAHNTTKPDTQADFRSTAFLQPARDILHKAGLWDLLINHTTPLQIMRLVDAGGTENVIRSITDFNAQEISTEPFAWNILNSILRRKLLDYITQTPNAQLLTGISTGAFITRIDHAIVHIGDQRYRTKLLIAADGRHSPIRTHLNINTKTIRYGQKALSFAVSHERAHNNISTEIYRTGGPFTTVPLPHYNQRHSSSIVWMEHAAKATDLFTLPKDQFLAALNERSCGILGDIELISDRNLWPIITQKSKTLYAQRVALIAEAAHVIPPIGAQGLNMSISDITALLETTKDHPLGSVTHLQAYSKARQSDIALRLRGIDILNRIAMSKSHNIRNMRQYMLNKLNTISFIRQGLMKKGLE